MKAGLIFTTKQTYAIFLGLSRQRIVIAIHRSSQHDRELSCAEPRYQDVNSLASVDVSEHLERQSIGLQTGGYYDADFRQLCPPDPLDTLAPVCHTN